MNSSWNQLFFSEKDKTLSIISQFLFIDTRKIVKIGLYYIKGAIHLIMLSTNTLIKWTEFYYYYLEQNDLETATRLKELLQKANKEDLIFTFCGHYSAGKSSMINKLTNSEVLPASPIPTTANIIRIKKGNNQIKVSFVDNKTTVYQNCIDIERVLQDIDNKEVIKELDVQIENNLELNNQTIYMDTPGIDSTDKAHELATESSIHLADCIFYVVDFNHVQSEVNFQFTKELMQAGKKFTLVINQMDKHREEEIPLNVFQKSVSDAFLSYGIKPEKIFYTSTKENSTFYNGLSEINQYMNEIIAKKSSVYPVTLETSFQKLYKDHQINMKIRFADEIAEYEEVLSDLSETQYGDLEDNYKHLNNLITTMEDEEKRIIADLEDEYSSLIKNAYIMPYQIRELAKAYLETEQGNFKIGFFSSKSKVEKEKENRLHAFFEQLKEIVEVQLITPLIHFFEKNGNELSISFINEIQNVVRKERLKALVNKDAHLSENYVLVFCEAVETEIKQLIKKEVQNIFLKWQDERHSLIIHDKNKIEMEIKEVAQYLEAKQKKEQLLKEQRQWKCSVEELLTTKPILTEKDFYQTLTSEEEVTYKDIDTIKELHDYASDEEVKELVISRKVPIVQEELNAEHTIKQLETLSSKLKSIKGFSHIAKQLSTKAMDIKNRTYTICLFGAFSAGKSSFANALLENQILPVSPNPTTATINRILPVDSSHPNKSVIVKWKTETEMLREINDYLQLIKKEAQTLEEAQNIIKNSKNNPIDRYENEFRYLDAFLTGYSMNKKFLGSEMDSNLEHLSDYVSVEETSCFVSSIDVYFDCPLTRKGITLVDTPGGDSINSRHTELSFEYMKNADCIFYVSYYNHAFSKADRSFLLQLGRLKDAFEKDKIFFVINAIDLAKNDVEQNAVKKYLYNQLQEYGIHNPRILAVSSLYYKDPYYGKWMDQAKEQLYHFIEHEWLHFMLLSGNRDYLDTIELIKKLILSARNKKQESKQELARLEQEKEKVIELLEMDTAVELHTKVQREIEEQLFYVKQRVFFRLIEIIKDAFHPSILKGENKKKELSLATTTFLIQLNYEFEQELRVVNIRLNQFFTKLINSISIQLQEKIQMINEDIKIKQDYSFNENNTLTYHATYKELDNSVNKLGNKVYKNPNSFFERNDRKKFAEELEKLIDSQTMEFLKEQTERLKEFYQEQYDQMNSIKLIELRNQMEEYYEGKMGLFTKQENIELLEDILYEVVEI